MENFWVKENIRMERKKDFGKNIGLMENLEDEMRICAYEQGYGVVSDNIEWLPAIIMFDIWDIMRGEDD